MRAPEWHSEVLPFLEKQMKTAAAAIAEHGLSIQDTEFQRGKLHALKLVEALAQPPKKPTTFQE